MSDPLRLALHGLERVEESARDEIVVVVRREVEPLVREAGKTLMLTLGSSPGNLNIDFTSSKATARRCGPTVLGEDAAGVIYVNAHRELRVCSAVNPKAGNRDARRFLGTGYLLGRALANTAIHELGHFIANLDHVGDSSNYMITGDPPPQERTVRGKQKFFAGRQSFTSDQRQKLVKQIRAGEWLGDFVVQ
jgi:hypothetical protein